VRAPPGPAAAADYTTATAVPLGSCARLCPAATTPVSRQTPAEHRKRRRVIGRSPAGPSQTTRQPAFRKVSARDTQTNVFSRCSSATTGGAFTTAMTTRLNARPEEHDESQPRRPADPWRPWRRRAQPPGPSRPGMPRPARCAGDGGWFSGAARRAAARQASKGIGPSRREGSSPSAHPRRKCRRAIARNLSPRLHGPSSRRQSAGRCRSPRSGRQLAERTALSAFRQAWQALLLPVRTLVLGGGH
jgi:hypothetical protein